MAGAILIAGVLASPRVRAQEASGLPDQMVGLQGRGGVAALAGEGAGDVDQPPLSHLSGSLQVRLLPSWYAELSTFGERTLKASAPEGKTTLGIEGTTLGVRRRAAFAKSPGTRLILGGGGGSGRVFVQGKGVEGQGGSFGGGMAYVLGGVEKEVSVDNFGSAGYVGVEALAQQYFVGEESPFRGTGVTVRVTFSFYMSGSYCSDFM